jgi:hypothetical protein
MKGYGRIHSHTCLRSRSSKTHLHSNIQLLLNMRHCVTKCFGFLRYNNPLHGLYHSEEEFDNPHSLRTSLAKTIDRDTEQEGIEKSKSRRFNEVEGICKARTQSMDKTKI